MLCAPIIVHKIIFQKSETSATGAFWFGFIIGSGTEKGIKCCVASGALNARNSVKFTQIINKVRF